MLLRSFDTCFFSLMFKIEVNGENASPLYKFLKEQKGGLFGDSIKWNFAKFLVDKQGNVVDRYAPTTSPLEIEVSRHCIPTHIDIRFFRICLTF